MGAFNSDGSVNSGFTFTGGSTKAAVAAAIPRPGAINWDQAAAAATSNAASQKLASERAKSAAFVASQKNAKPVKEEGAFDNIPVVGKALSHISNIAIGIVKPIAESVAGTGTAGLTSQQEKQAIQQQASGKTATSKTISNPQEAGHAQSNLSQAEGAITARMLIKAPAEDFIKELVGSKIPGVAGKITASAAAQAHQVGLLSGLSTAAEPGATTKDVIRSYGTGALTGLALGAGGEAAGLAAKGTVKAVAGKIADARAPKVAPEPAVTSPNVLDNLPKVQPGDKTRQAVVNRNAAIAATTNTFHEQEANVLAAKVNPKDWSTFRSLDDSKDRTPAATDARIVRVANAKIADPTDRANFIAYARLHQQDAETAFNHRNALYPDQVGHVGNYQQRFYADNPSNKGALAELEGQQPRAVKGSPGYTKSRTQPGYGTQIPLRDDEGNLVKDENGKQQYTTLQPRNENPHQDYLDMIHQTASQNGSAALIKGLREAHPGAIYHVGVSPTGDSLGNLKIAGAKGYSASDAVAKFYNHRAPTDLSTTADIDKTVGQKFRQGYKDYINRPLKSIKLAGGLFHGARTGITTAGQQLMSLKRNVTHPLMQAADNLRLIGSTVSSRVHANWMKQLASDSKDNVDGVDTLQRSRLANLTTNMKSLQGDLVGGQKSIINRIPGFKQTYQAVFDRQIPAAKLMMFHQLTGDLDTRVPGDLAKMRQIADGINRGIGGIDNYTSGLTPKMASAADNLILGRDLNEGIVATLGHALRPNSTDGRVARQFVIGASTVAALPGLVALVSTGQVNPKDPEAMAKAFVEQFGNPQIPTPWHNPLTASEKARGETQGSPVSLKLPTTFLSLVVKSLQPALDPAATYDNDRYSGLKDLASARLAAPLALGEELKTNTDYYGNPIFGGGPVKSAQNLLSTVLPIPAAQANRVSSGAENATEAGLSELGLRPSTSTLPSASLTGTQYRNELYNVYNAKGSPIPTQHSAVVKAIDAAANAHNTAKATRIANQWNNVTLPKLIAPFIQKYPAYGKLYKTDANYTKLHISPKASAVATRARNSAASLKVEKAY